MKLFVVLFLILLPLLGFSQEEVSTGTDTATQDEAALAELENARAERQKSMEQVAKIAETTQKAFDPTAELKKIGYDSFTPGAFLNKDALLILERTLKEAKMHTFPPELIREKFYEAFKGHSLEGFFKRSPRLVDFFVDVLRDEKALAAGIQILKDKEKVKYYLYIWIVIMFLSYFTRNLFVSKYWSRGYRTLASLMFSITISVITISSFFLVFQTEMKPILIIIKRYI